MSLNIAKEVVALEQMTVGQLQDRYVEVFGEPVRSRHRQYLIRRIAWRLQANAEGGLSERALRRAEELADDADVRLTPPRWATPVRQVRPAGLSVVRVPVPKDPRLPSAGSQITRKYKSRTIIVTVLADGFEYLGERYRSLTTIAKAITRVRALEERIACEISFPCLLGYRYDIGRERIRSCRQPRPSSRILKFEPLFDFVSTLLLTWRISFRSVGGGYGVVDDAAASIVSQGVNTINGELPAGSVNCRQVGRTGFGSPAALQRAPVDGLQPAVGLDESLAPAFPLVRNSLGFDLVKSLRLRDLASHKIHHFHKHLVIGLDVVERGERAVTGNEFGIGRSVGDDPGDVSSHALDIAAVVEIDERKHSHEHVVAHMDHIGLGEEYDTVAVSVTVWQVQYADLLVIEVHG